MAISGEKRWPRMGRNRWPLTAATIFVACTSRPTRLLAFAMAGFLPYAVVGRRTGTSRAAQNPPNNSSGGTSLFYLQGRTDLNPYCLAARHPEGAGFVRLAWLP